MLTSLARRKKHHTQCTWSYVILLIHIYPFTLGDSFTVFTWWQWWLRIKAVNSTSQCAKSSAGHARRWSSRRWRKSTCWQCTLKYSKIYVRNIRTLRNTRKTCGTMKNHTEGWKTFFRLVSVFLIPFAVVIYSNIVLDISSMTLIQLCVVDWFLCECAWDASLFIV